MYEYDSTTVFMNYEMAQTHFRFPNQASAIEIFIDDLKDFETVKSQIREVLANRDDLYATDWQQANASFIEALKVERTVMFFILTLIIIVAAFNIISSMIMLVNDKNKNIALLRTLGMTKGSVMRIFLICGSSIGVVGTFLGFVIGVLFSANIQTIKSALESLTGATLFNPAIYFLSTLPSKIFVSDVVLITVMALVISFLATIYPAYKASKANPAELLRYE
jgi:lipoprotein-releasing system permease protein